MSMTDFSRNLKSALNKVEVAGEEIVLVRNKRRIGRIVPGEPFMTAAEAMGDLGGILPDDAAEGWLVSISSFIRSDLFLRSSAVLRDVSY
jgi:hypothetical protein